MNSVKSKILAVKHQADELEYRINEIDNGDDAWMILVFDKNGDFNNPTGT